MRSLVFTLLLFSVCLFANNDIFMNVINIKGEYLVADKGSKSGVREGDVFNVMRFTENELDLLAKARVSIVRKNICGLKILGRHKQDSIEEGDVLVIWKSYKQGNNSVFTNNSRAGYPSHKRTFYGIYSRPGGNFGDRDITNDKAVMAKNGFGLGFDYSTPVGAPDLYFISSLHFLYNHIDENILNELRTSLNYKCQRRFNINFSSEPWYVIPIMGGLEYNIFPQEGLGFYTLGTFGVGFIPERNVKITDYCWSNDTIYHFQIKQEMVIKECFSVGAGIILNRRLNLGLRYINFGNVQVDTENIKWLKNEHKISEKSILRTMDITLLTLGFTF